MLYLEPSQLFNMWLHWNLLFKLLPFLIKYQTNYDQSPHVRCLKIVSEINKKLMYTQLAFTTSQSQLDLTRLEFRIVVITKTLVSVTTWLLFQITASTVSEWRSTWRGYSFVLISLCWRVLYEYEYNPICLCLRVLKEFLEYQLWPYKSWFLPHNILLNLIKKMLIT